MSVIQDTTIKGRMKPGEYAGHSFKNCVFDHCIVTRQAVPGDWTIIRDIDLYSVTNNCCSIETAILQDVTLHELKKLGRFPLFLWGCAFKHVTLSGKISSLKINRYVEAGVSAATQSAWDINVAELYSDTDWALDISQARFTSSVSLEAIPGDKIRRDPETQALVTRSQLQSCDWQSIDYGDSAFNVAIDWFLEHSIFDSVVLAARTGAKNAKSDISVLNALREQGVAT